MTRAPSSDKLHTPLMRHQLDSSGGKRQRYFSDTLKDHQLNALNLKVLVSFAATFSANDK